MTRAFVLRVGHKLVVHAGVGAYQITGQAASLVHDVNPPTLTRVGTTFELDGVAVMPFGLRTANALQDDTIMQRLIDAFPSMLLHGMQAIVFNFQGGRAFDSSNSLFNGFNANGTLKAEFSNRAVALVEAAEAAGIIWWAQCFYRGQDEFLTDDNAVRAAVSAVTTLLSPYRGGGFHLINEPMHEGYDRAILTSTAGRVELYGQVKTADPSRICYASHESGANDGWLMDSWTRNGVGTGMAAGSVCVEYLRYDGYSAPAVGVFTGTQISDSESHITAVHGIPAYFYWHAAYHQKADAVGWPKFEKGGVGSSADPGCAFAWNKMQTLGA